MSEVSLSAVESTLRASDVEIYGVENDTIRVAERIRFHLMDSGVRVQLSGGAIAVLFEARCQRSDFPDGASPQLLELVRNRLGAAAGAAGFGEHSAGAREIHDPNRPDQLLDLWHEVTYRRTVTDLAAVVDAVRAALAIDKYVTP